MAEQISIRAAIARFRNHPPTHRSQRTRPRPVAPTPVAEKAGPEKPAALFYIDEADNNRRVGPVSLSEFRKRVSSGALPATTPVWTTGMRDWVRVNRLNVRQKSERGAAPPTAQTSPRPTAAAAPAAAAAAAATTATTATTAATAAATAAAAAAAATATRTCIKNLAMTLSRSVVRGAVTRVSHEAAANMLQRQARATAARRQVQVLRLRRDKRRRQQARVAAALLLQSLIRGSRARKLVATLRRKHELRRARQRCALQLQCWFRKCSRDRRRRCLRRCRLQERCRSSGVGSGQDSSNRVTPPSCDLPTVPRTPLPVRRMRVLRAALIGEIDGVEQQRNAPVLLPPSSSSSSTSSSSSPSTVTALVACTDAGKSSTARPAALVERTNKRAVDPFALAVNLRRRLEGEIARCAGQKQTGRFQTANSKEKE